MLIVRTGSGYLEPSLSCAAVGSDCWGTFPGCTEHFFSSHLFSLALHLLYSYCMLLTFACSFLQCFSFFILFVVCDLSMLLFFFPSLSPQTPAGRDRWLPLPEPRSARGFFLFKRMFIHIDDCCRLCTQILFEIELNQTEFIFLSLLSV